MSKKIVFIGTIVSPSAIDKIDVFSGFLSVEEGIISCVSSDKEEFPKHNWDEYEVIHLNRDQFLMPGFVDCHTHAPQFPNIGLGLDRPLLEWLDKYTFPLEKKYADVEFASQVYDTVVRRLLNNGTTTACYFGSLHLKGTLELANSAQKYGQRAFVGKVSMNIKNDAGYYNDTDTELKETDTFVKTILDFKNDLIQPIVTPRFAVSCDKTLMLGLSALASKYGCRIQSHISENIKEIEHVLEINPGCASYSEVYNKSKVFDNMCIMAHAIHLSDEEISTFAAKGITVAHCPASNTRLKSGLCPVKKLLEGGVTVGLGTDVSGGDNASIIDAMRRTMDVSTHLELQGRSTESIDWKGAFYLGTLGGAKALHLENKIGSFKKGKEFDALIVDVYADGQIDNYGYSIAESKEDYAVGLIQKFIYVGDDRNIVQVYVKGKKVRHNMPLDVST